MTLKVYLGLCVLVAIGVPILIWRVIAREKRAVSETWLNETAYDRTGDRE